MFQIISKLKKQILLLIILPSFLLADTDWQSKIPEQLKPWVPWVTRDLKLNTCPYLYNDFNAKNCLWNKTLELEIYDQVKANFKVNAFVNEENFLTLPGNTNAWPLEVFTNNDKQAVIEKSGLPMIWLIPGEYTITGKFSWKKAPTELQIPSSLALLKVNINGKEITTPEFSSASTLILSKQEITVENVKNSLDIKVFRKLVDGLPNTLETLIRLNVSGKIRETDFKQILPEGFNIFDINSNLPFALKNNNLLTVQLKPGNWEINIKAFNLNPASEITLSSNLANWSTQELWAFQSAPELRVVDLQANLIDPNQTDLPYDWKNLNVFLLEAGQSIKFKETQRGDSNPRTNELNLTRNLKLNFNGKGYSLIDHINGVVNTESRLELNKDLKLGALKIDGIDQVINEVKTGANPGVELRNGSLNLEAEARIEKSTKILPVLGWNHNFNFVETYLTLPPGWKVLHATGADDSYPTWIAGWTLLEVFLVMVCSILVYKLFGRIPGLLTTVGLILLHQELDIKNSLLTLLIIAAVSTALKAGKLLKLANFINLILILALVFKVLPFIIYDIRNSIFPQLESGFGFGEQVFSRQVLAPASAPVAGYDQPVFSDRLDAVGKSFDRRALSGEYRAKEMDLSSEQVARKQNLYSQSNIAQTGFGKINWSKSDYVHLIWKGPVSSEESFKIYFLSPVFNLIFAFLRAFFIIYILYLLITTFNFAKLKFTTNALKASLFLCLLAINSLHAEEFPDANTLQELKTYVTTELTKEPECKTECASISELNLEASGNNLKFYYTIHAASDLIIPISFNRNDWALTAITINDSEPQFIFENSKLLVGVKKGVSNLILQGRSSSKDTLNFSFELLPKKLNFNSNDWEILGVTDGVPSSSIQLNRIKAESVLDNSQNKTLSDNEIAYAPLIIVKRNLDLGINATVSTIIERLSPARNLVKIKIPLMSGESVTSSDVEVKDGIAEINLAPGVTSKNINSSLEIDSELTLTNQTSANWQEQWSLNATNEWHIEYEGTPRIYSNLIDSQKFFWSPRIGENLKLKIFKPLASSGPTKTIEKSKLIASPGERKTDYVLNFTIKSSKGEDHVIQISDKAELKSLKINTIAQASKLNQGKLTLKLAPGNQEVEVSWTEKTGIRNLLTASKIDLGIPSVNHDVEITMPKNRWILFVKNTVMSPVVLFWGLLPVIIIIAVILGKVKLFPLKTWQWILLLVGLSQVNLALNVAIIVWFILFGLRGRQESYGKRIFFGQIKQLALFIFTILAFSALCEAIRTGLLGSPQMRILGNGSYAYFLRWYFDMAESVLPQPKVFSLHILYYRLLMLAWASWLAFSCVTWGKWGWQCFSKGGYWVKREKA